MGGFFFTRHPVSWSSMRSDVRGSPVGQEIGEERFSISFFDVAQKLASLDLRVQAFPGLLPRKPHGLLCRT